MSADGTPAATTTMVRLNTLIESPWQPPVRSERNLDGLVASIKQHGITSRLIVRRIGPVKDGALEIIEGHRTRAAALLAGVEEAEARVLEGLDDERARELFYISNAHRLDMTPPEEATLFGGMRDAGWTPERIAERSGKSLTTVNKRLVLLGLIPKAREALDEGKLLLCIAEQLALLAPADQAMAMGQLKTDEEPVGRRLGLRILQAYQRSLADAPWGLADAELLPEAGACTVCPKRTKAQLVLIGEETGDGDRCLDGKCFEVKRRLHAEEMHQLAEEEEEDSNPTKSDCNPSKAAAKSERSPSGPVTRIEPLAPPPDFERLADDAARERAIEAVAEAADRKRKIDEKSLRFLVQLFLTASSEDVIGRVATRRIGPALDAGADEILRGVISGAGGNHARIFSLGVELAVTSALENGAGDETALDLACRHLGVNRDDLRAEELARLKKEHAKSTKEKPTPGKRVGSTPRKRAIEAVPDLEALNEERCLEPTNPLCACPVHKDEPVAKCAVCGLDASREPSVFTHHWIDEREDVCSACEPLLDAIEETLTEKPRHEADVITDALDALDGYFDGPHAEKAIGALIERERAALFIDGTGKNARKIAIYAKKNVEHDAPCAPPGRCRVCRCTEAAPCLRDGDESCVWADTKKNLCTACADLITATETELKVGEKPAAEIVEAILGRAGGPAVTQKRMLKVLEDMKASGVIRWTLGERGAVFSLVKRVSAHRPARERR